MDLSQESEGSVAETEVVNSDSQEGLAVPPDDLKSLPAEVFDDPNMPVDKLLDFVASDIDDNSNMRDVEMTENTSSSIQGKSDQIGAVGGPKGSVQAVLTPQVSDQPTKVDTTCASTPISDTVPHQKSLDMEGTNASSKRRKRERGADEPAAEPNQGKKIKPGD